MADATERPTLVPETYPELEREVYLSLEPRTERPTEPVPYALDELAEAVMRGKSVRDTAFPFADYVPRPSWAELPFWILPFAFPEERRDVLARLP